MELRLSLAIDILLLVYTVLLLYILKCISGQEFLSVTDMENSSALKLNKIIKMCLDNILIYREVGGNTLARNKPCNIIYIKSQEKKKRKTSQFRLMFYFHNSST